MANIYKIYDIEIFKPTKKDTGVELSINQYNHNQETYFKSKIGLAFKCKKIKNFPVIFSADKSLWVEANLFLLSYYKRLPVKSASTIETVAYSLLSFKNWCEEHQVDMFEDHEEWGSRITIKYATHLNYLVLENKLTPRTAKKNLSAVVQMFYWMDHMGCQYKYDLFEGVTLSQTQYYEKNLKNERRGLLVNSEIYSLIKPHKNRKYQGSIYDMERLTPLSKTDVDDVLHALESISNPEMSLIFLMILTTGARKQTILTMPRNIFNEEVMFVNGYCTIPTGPGTGIDTKFNKRNILHIPKKMYEKLRVYCKSDRAISRLNKSKYRKCSDQENYLFITKFKNPYYHREGDNLAKDQGKVGRAINAFMHQSLFPELEKKGNKIKFTFHDLRATFAINFIEAEFEKYCKENNTKTDVLDIKHPAYYHILEALQSVMWHDNIKTTMDYLNFNSKLATHHKTQDQYEEFLDSI